MFIPVTDPQMGVEDVFVHITICNVFMEVENGPKCKASSTRRKTGAETKPLLTSTQACSWAVTKANILTKSGTNQDFVSQALTDCQEGNT